jgi:catechol 2,3-dioxygenase-like lactoylglutathione lyase family enzyme
MDPWPKGIAAITLFVEDLAAAREFYVDVFGLPVHFEDEDSAVFKFGDTLVNLLKVEEAKELIEPAAGGTSRSGSAVSVHAGSGRRGRHVRATCRAGRAAPERADGSAVGAGTASFIDPGGHIWEIAH